MPSKELVDYLRTQGRQVKSHMSSVDDAVANILRDRLKPKTAPKPAGTSTAKSDGAGRSRTSTGGASSPGNRSDSSDSSGGARGGRRGRTDDDARRTDGRGGTGGGGGSPGGAAGGGRGRKVRRFFPDHETTSFAATCGCGGRRRGGRPRPGLPDGGRNATAQIPELPDSVAVYAPVALKDLSAALGIKSQLLVKKLMQAGKLVTINQYLDDETILELGVDLGVEINVRSKTDDLEEAVRELEKHESSEEDLVIRAPVVTFLGHVDHGKTSLLDKIREANVTRGEEGGITQHLGAYRVDNDDANIHVTFIDTPGHKAFTEMRARGATATDIAVLVVAADDGPKPQTEEALAHARAANVPIVVALNKVDLPAANVDRCKQELTKLELMPTEWGGKTEFVEVSAMTGQGLDSLLETLSLEAEILELKANPDRPAVGVVLEAQPTTQRGVVATVLVQDGTLRVGDYVLCGASHGRVRNLILNGDTTLDAAGPSYPVQVIGLNEVPVTGDRFIVVSDEKQARKLAEDRFHLLRESERVRRPALTLENFEEMMKTESVQELRLILKADVRGSADALKASLEELTHDEVRVAILHTGVGAITQEDIHLAAASQAVVLGFHVGPDDRAKSLADEEGVDIRQYKVIYEAIDDVRDALEQRLAPEIVEEIHGRAEVREVFKASKVGNIAGCIVSDGKINRNDKVRVIRGEKVLHTGTLDSLKRFKDDVKDVREGFECGVKVAGWDNIEVGDILECFVEIKKKRNL